MRMIMPTWPTEHTQAWPVLCTPYTEANAEAKSEAQSRKCHTAQAEGHAWADLVVWQLQGPSWWRPEIRDQNF